MSVLLYPSPEIVPIVGRWVSERMGYGANASAVFGSFYATAVIEPDTQKILAACVYSNYRDLRYGADIHLTFATDGPRWATRTNIGGFLHYPFRQLGCSRATAICSRNNRRIRKFIEGIGFRLEGKHARGWDGRTPAMSYGMLPEVAEPYLVKYEDWLNGQKFPVAAAAA